MFSPHAKLDIPEPDTDTGGGGGGVISCVRLLLFTSVFLAKFCSPEEKASEVKKKPILRRLTMDKTGQTLALIISDVWR